MKMSITNKRNSKKMNSIQRFWIRLCVVFACIVAQSGVAYAQRLNVDGQTSSKACVGEPIVLTATGFGAGVTAVDVYKSTTGGTNFKAIGSVSDPSGVFKFVDDMGNSTASYYIQEQKGTATTNTVTVNVNTDCPRICHQSSSGDYINGTDFNIPPYNTSTRVDVKPAENAQIESYFADYDVRFTINGCGAGRAITNDVSAYLGFVPKANASQYSNYYWVSDNNYSELNCAPFTFNFHMIDGQGNPIWDEKYYRLAMKAYVVKQAGCNDGCKNAQFKLETGVGSQDNFYGNADHMEIVVYDDETNQQLGQPFVINRSFGEIHVNSILCNDNYAGKLLRLEIHFYGKFSLKNKNKNSWVDLSPRFQQMGCMKVAVDYVSAEIMSVCMDNSAACIGDNVTVVAAGFPYNANYVWEVQNGNRWDQLRIGGFNMNGPNYREVSIPVNEVGKKKYRVRDSRTPEEAPIEFYVTGKNCEPIQPTEINGPANPFCIPNNKEDGKFSVAPIDANPDVRYTWTFTSPSGKTFGSDKIQFDGGELESDTRGASIYLLMDGNAEEGEYTVTVQPVKKEVYSNGEYAYVTAGEPISKKFTVYKTPQIVVAKQGTEGMDQTQVTLCPTDREQTLVAVADAKNGFHSIYESRYSYVWKYGATGKTYEALVSFPDSGACDGKYKEHTARVNVQIAGVGCPTTAQTTWKLSEIQKPTINCPANKNLEYTLGKTQKTYNVPWSFPSYTAGCETNPRLTIELNFSPDGNGENIHQLIETTRADIDKLTKYFSLPAGVGTIAYKVIDGCNNTALCVMNITVKDIFPPDLPCDQIPTLSTKLSYQEGCDAEPGHHGSLPIITPPVLEDQNGVDGLITGQYMGRVSNPVTIPTEQSFDASIFDVTIDVNENYVVGTSYILWKFADASGNVAYCIQKILVEDDRKPNVNCIDPNLGEVSSLEGKCGLSVNGLLSQMTEFPKGYDVCSGAGQEIDAVILYKDEEDDDYEVITRDRWDEIIFEVNHTYNIVWRFYKIYNNKIYEDCEASFTVRDNEPPVFNCSTLLPIRVTANSYKPLNKGYEYMDYASMEDVEVREGVGPAATVKVYTGTLKDYFENNNIRMIDPSEVTDNCGGEIFVTTRLEGPSDKDGRITSQNITSLKQLQDHKYFVGLTTITYTFIDESGNTSSCTQEIIVTAGTTPIPNCPADPNVTLYVDQECKANYILKKSEVPDAMIPVNQEGLWFNFRRTVIAGLHFDEECLIAQKYFLDSLDKVNGYHDYNGHKLTLDYLGENYLSDPDFLNSSLNCWRSWSSSYNPVGPGVGPGMGPGAGPGAGPAANCDGETILSASNKFTTVTEYLGYPFEVELLDSTGTTVKKVLNPYTEGDKATTNVMYARWFSNNSNHECNSLSYSFKDAPVKRLNNFNEEIFNLSLTKGVYKLVYRFQNEKDGLQLDSCVITVSVIDTIPPSLECGDWSKSGEFVAGPDCKVPVDSVPWFKKPTLADLNVKDNCSSDPNDFTISWRRSWGTYKDITMEAALTDAFSMGETTMKWVVTDKSGNESMCIQTINVVDKTGPIVDCSKLDTIHAETESNCEASAEAVIKAGLSIPYADDDQCSPTGGRIAGQGVRSDGRDIFTDPYPKGITVITWTFADSLNNTSICKQYVEVVDSMQPVISCEEIEDISIDLQPQHCTASKDTVRAILGSHSAQDDCDGDIIGVPHVLLPDETLADLFDSFMKDTTYVIVWTFTDQEGNEVRCSHNLRINDVTPPIVDTICKDPEKNLVATVECSLTYDELQLPSDESMILHGDCDGDIVPRKVAKVAQPDHTYLLYESNELKDIEYPVTAEGYPHIIWWIYTDKSMNRDTCQTLINITDDIPPVLEDCDVDPEISLTVSDTVCAIDPAEVKVYIREPKAHDVCDDYLGDVGLVWLDPVVERYYINKQCDINGTDTTCVYDTTLTADGINKKWDEDLFIKGRTLLRWIFTDTKGNTVECIKSVDVVDHTPPYFDCSKIDPDTLRPEAYPGECLVEFANLKKDVLDTLAYKAYDACSGDSIPGVLTLNGTMELPDSYTMQVGVMYKLLWLFKDEDGNSTTCPQWILPSHVNPIRFDCSTLDDTVVVVADEGTCTINTDSLKAHLTIPEAKDTCSSEVVYAVAYTADSTSSIDLNTYEFPTGDTKINWMFVSPWNLHDTLWCSQIVSVRGNKQFDIVCENVTPTVYDTISECFTDPMTFAVDTPWVGDPCLKESDPMYKRFGEGTRNDGYALNDSYPLGNTQIKWVFTDFTGSVDTFCIQDIEIRTDKEIIFNCDSLNKDTVKVDAVEGQCTVDASNVKLTTPFALHPCTFDTIYGTPVRKDGKKMDEPYYVGITVIKWIFADTTNTLANPMVSCDQYVQVGDVNVPPIDCENFPDRVYRLNPNNCSIEWSEMDFEVKAVIDLCSKDTINPTVSRYSGEPIIAETYNDNGEAKVKITTTKFNVGVDTIYWDYSFHGMEYHCQQTITVMDSMAPIFDCSTLEDIEVPAVTGTCEAPSSAVYDSLPNPWPAATEYCTGDSILGRVYLDEITAKSELTSASSFDVSVGDHKLIWVFIDPVINAIGDTCYQNLTVKSDIKPEINCDTLASRLDSIIIEGCDTLLNEDKIPTPYALDACTKDTIYGVGERLDGKDLYKDVYPVGTTIIRWTFVSPFSYDTAICDEPIVVLSSQELEFNCDDLKDTVVFDVKEGECNTIITLPTYFAKHPCPEQSKVDKIEGIPTIGGTPMNKQGDEWVLEMRTGIWEVLWTFTDTSNTLLTPVKTCIEPVKVGDTNQMPVDCQNYPDTVIKLSPLDCEISWSSIGFKAPEVVDLCSQEVIVPELTRWSQKTMEENFTVGLDTVYWSYSFAGQKMVCKQAIDVLDSVAPSFDCSLLKPIVMVAPVGTCEVSSEALTDSLGEWFAEDFCTHKQIKGVALVDSVPVADVTAHVGDTLIVHWIFKDDTLNAVAKECDQLVTVIGQAEPIFDCSTLKDSIFYLHVGQCAKPGDEVILGIPVAVDSCTGTPVNGVPSRQDSLAMTDDFPLGETIINWTFTSEFSLTSKVCTQKVVIKDTIAPDVDCTVLPDTIKARITDSSKYDDAITYEELKNTPNFTIPTVKDLCDGIITAEGTRSDGKPMDDLYPLGVVDITWTYTDKSGNSATCHQVILVEDYLIDTLYCPKGWNHNTITCTDELPKVYETYDEFVAAGGRFSNTSKMKENSFRMTEEFKGVQYCDETYYRTYHVTDVRNNDITCTDTIYVVDNIAPKFNVDLKDITIACTDNVPAVEHVEVTDCDPSPKLEMKEVSYQGSDPSKCDYYTYNIVRDWKATDRCGNVSTMRQTIHVVDTIGPTFNFPGNWKDSVLSVYRKGCLFEVPDFSVDVAAIVTDNCSDVSNLRIVQTPRAGTYITHTTDVVVKVYDMCDNIDSLKINVYVPLKKDVVTVIAKDTVSCVSDSIRINLMDQNLRFASGMYLQEDTWNHEFYKVGSTFFYDIYRGEISRENIVYSTNPNTYASKFRNKQDEYVMLNRQSYTDRYYFVASDTLTLCADTASSYIRLKERPRVSMTSGEEDICELVHVDSTMLYSYLQCVDNMGGDTILSEGWLYGGLKFDLEKDTIPYSADHKYFSYYSENECGVSTSMNSYFSFCGDTTIRTKKDTLAVLGDSTLLDDLRKDKLIVSDSILMIVHQRMLPQGITITTEPHDPARIWLGEYVELEMRTIYPYSEMSWYKVKGEYDRKDLMVGKDEHEFEFDESSGDEQDSLMSTSLYSEVQNILDNPQDTAKYYVTLSDKVCPSIASDLVQVNVILKLPTAFTPYDKDGWNDVFMERHYIIIFDRYGQKVFEGNDGWDGTFKGAMADPGVYYYVVTMTDGSIRKGTVELIFLRK
ncbi:MAG: gliding motility-associated C-terminal domain-containing protein [Paludibacteraceae bacterium]|nr:gliding motility-associated C-terminal domain-containing protein [Paludibacteraceae bacterium]